MSEIAEYVRVLFFRAYAKEIPLPAGFVRRQEMVSGIEVMLATALDSYDAATITDLSAVANVIFDELAGNGPIEVISDPIAKDYFSVVPDQFALYRTSVLKSSGIYQTSKRVGERFFPDVFTSYRATPSEIDGLTAEQLEIPASDRVVTLNDNQELIDTISSGLDQIAKEVATSNEVGDILGDEKDRIVSELRAGDLIITTKAARVSVVLELLLKPLRYIADKFAGAALGELAKQMIVLIIKALSS